MSANSIDKLSIRHKKTNTVINNDKRFADYFVICGLDFESGLEPDRISGHNMHCSPIDRAYKGKPLAHYPENCSWNPFDAHGICMLSLPQGLRFKTQKHCLEPKFHSFATTREDGKRCYGFSLVFYEEVWNKNICNAMHTLQSMFITETSSGQMSLGMRRIKEGPVSRSLPRHFRLAPHTPASAISYYDITKDKLYVAKSLSLVCQIAFAHVAELFLKNLYKCIPKQPGQSLSLESYVHNILFEVPIPEPGQSIRIYLPNDKAHLPPIATILQRPSTICELPLLDFPLRLLFSYLDIECVIQLFTCVLLEYQVLLRSEDYHKLMIVGECIVALLFPFNWPHVYAPILPAALHHFLDAPVPFVMGLHADAESNFKIGSEATLCYVDIDKKSIQAPDELPIFPQKGDFMLEISAVLGKFNGYHEKSNNVSSTVINPISSIHHEKLKLQPKYNYHQFDVDTPTSNSKLPSSMYVRKKHSLHDTLDWDRANSPPLENNAQQTSTTQPVPLSDALERMVDIVKRTDVKLDVIDCDTKIGSSSRTLLTTHEQYCEDLRLNNCIREIFLNRFVQLFAAYENFLILPNQNKDEWLTNRESLQNFDKSSFLSDQQQHHRPFLSRFLESQMFATLIDNKIMSLWDEEVDNSLNLFDNRIKILRRRYGGESTMRAANYEPTTFTCDTQRLLDKRLNVIDYEVAPPIEILTNRPAYFKSFPILEKSVLNQESSSRGNSLRRINNSTKWSAEEISIDGKPPKFSSANAAANRNTASLSVSDMSPALIAQANWTFVEKLLRDCKSKTKRMLLEKMGSEATVLGFSKDVSIIGMEENTLIGSLCDLLEKIWSHGVHNKQQKSALWTHLQAYLEKHKSSNPPSQSIDNYLVPDLSSHASESNSSHDSHRSRSKSRDRKVIANEELKELPTSLEFDIRNILAMADIKTHIGQARAWIRLSLEKKLLSRHFRVLLSDTALLRVLYKRSSFVRCDEEREQFLYHLLTLNAVDYFCFTNTYSATVLPYKVVIYSPKKLSPATADIWLAVSGSISETQQIHVPRGAVEFVFHHKNLGILTTLRIGQSSTEHNNKWMLEQVIVRNEVTAHTYKFPCGRWLGRAVDDGSIERLLVSQLITKATDNEELIESCKTPPRAQSPSPHRVHIKPTDMQHKLGDCVNSIVKWHYRPARERDNTSLTNLLCGEDGLVKCMENILLYGFKSQRLFGRNLYIWDFFVKVKEHFDVNLVEVSVDAIRGGASNKSNSDSPARQELVTLWRCYICIIDKINNAVQTLGKDGKFQLFICLSLREHLLHRLLIPIANCAVTQDMYEEQSFLRNKGLLTFLRQIIEPLDEFNIVLENSVTQGILFHR